MAIKLLIGGSPCTHWSIARRNNREVTASGVGWELFRNFLIAKEKFQPDYFLYENNKSAARAIQEQIARELGVGVDPDARFTYINSALVSAQSRQRFYVTNFGDIQPPADRGILLKDILESGENATGGEKSFCLTASYGGACAWNTIERSQRTMVAEPIYVGEVPGHGGKYRNGNQVSIQYRVHSVEGKATCCDNNCRRKYIAVPVAEQTAHASGENTIEWLDGKTYTLYEVRNGIIHTHGTDYAMRLKDGFYIIRKLTVAECCRLQTLPDDYCKAVSNAQAYRALGNGWTAEVIIHLLHHALKDVPRNTELIVLSLYDGIATGRYCLEKLGFTNVFYHSYEIDKFAISVAMDNYPDIVQHGDAFGVREDTWAPPQTRSEWLDELLGGG